MRRYLLLILGDVLAIFFLISTSYSISYKSCKSYSKEASVCRIDTSNVHKNDNYKNIYIDIIIVVGILLVISPYVFPFIMAGVSGGYKSGWDASLGEAFGGNLGTGFSGFSGRDRDVSW